MTDSVISGELLVRNGPRPGARLPLRLPVTAVGSGDGCDVRVEADGVAPLHLLLVAEGGELRLRSWQPDATLVNGAATDGCVLRHGDELRVGACALEVSWFAEPLVPLKAADPAAVRARFEQLRRDAEGHAAAGPHSKMTGMLLSLAAGREELRREREAFRAERVAAEGTLREKARAVTPLHDEAHDDRRRARQLLLRYRRHVQRRTAALEAERAKLEQYADAVRRERDKFEAHAAGTRDKVQAAWDRVAELERRARAERQKAEDSAAERAANAEALAAELAAREAALAAAASGWAERQAELAAEAEALEVRAANARDALAKLEEQRAKLEGGLALADSAVVAAPLSDRVALARQGVPPETFLAQLHHWEREVTRERQKLAAARAELEKRESDLSDGRELLAEQVARMGAARDGRHDGEQAFVRELEDLARALHVRELALQAREREAERAARKAEDDARANFAERGRLAEWSTSLAARAESLSTERDRALYGLRDAQTKLARREGALGTLLGKWANVRRREREELRAERSKLAALERHYAAAVTEAGRVRGELLADAARVAERALAAEQAVGEAAKQTSPRRVRVLRRAWERHFDRARRDAEKRSAELAARLAELASATASAGEALDRLAAERADLKAGQFALELHRMHDANPVD